MSEAKSFEDLTEWHDAPAILGEFRERFTPESLKGVEPQFPLRFQVIREEWGEGADGIPERTILEVKVVSA